MDKIIQIVLVLENCESIVIPSSHIINFSFNIDSLQYSQCNTDRLHTHAITNDFYMAIKDLHTLYVSGFVGDTNKVVALERLNRSNDVTNVELVTESDKGVITKVYVGVPWGGLEYVNPHMTLRKHKGYYNYNCENDKSIAHELHITNKVTMAVIINYIKYHIRVMIYKLNVGRIIKYIIHKYKYGW